MGGALLVIITTVIAGLILRNKNLIDIRVNAVIEHINKMESHGHEYWSHDHTYPRNKLLEVEIKRLSRRVGVELKQLNNDCMGYYFNKNNQKVLTQFRQSITGGSFESASRQADEDVKQNITTMCNLLIDRCRKSVKLYIIF